MKILVNNKPIELTQKLFLASGGQADCYAIGDKVYKIYHNPSEMIPEGKINELSVLKEDNIINPLDIIYDTKGKQIGYTMKFIASANPICKLFTKDFKKRFNVTDSIILDIIKKIQKGISYVHSCGFIIVDGNELNYLVNNKLTTPYFIDCDNWQTKNYSAQAQMLSIKDFHTNGFNEGSDWFSFAILCSQLWLGIHPYKGLHPSIKGFEDRMKANVSIFNKDVKVPSVVPSFTVIPSNYTEWLYKTLEKGERILPPNTEGNIMVGIFIKDTSVIKSGKFIIDLIKEFAQNIIRVTKNGVIFEGGLDIIRATSSTDLIHINVKNNKLIVKNKDTLNSYIVAEDKMVYEDTVFVKNGELLTSYTIFGKNLVANNVWNVLPNATKLFNQCVYQDILGKAYFMIPFINNKNQVMLNQLFIKELDKYNILEAKYMNGILVVTGSKNNKYDIFTIKIKDSNYYISKIDKDTSYYLPNFTVNSNGICLKISHEDKLEAFSNRIDKTDIYIYEDQFINSDTKLCLLENGSIGIFKENKLYKFSLSK